MKTSYKLFSLFCIILWMPLVQGAICSPKDAEAADAMVDTLDSWTQVDHTFMKFKQCDDGSIAEGNAEAIARLLVDKWDTLPLLEKLIKKNPALKGFVLQHINTTLDTNDLEKIKENASSHCLKNLDSLCGELNKAAVEALVN